MRQCSSSDLQIVESNRHALAFQVTSNLRLELRARIVKGKALERTQHQIHFTAIGDRVGTTQASVIQFGNNDRADTNLARLPGTKPRHHRRMRIAQNTTQAFVSKRYVIPSVTRTVCKTSPLLWCKNPRLSRCLQSEIASTRHRYGDSGRLTDTLFSLRPTPEDARQRTEGEPHD